MQSLGGKYIFKYTKFITHLSSGEKIYCILSTDSFQKALSRQISPS